VVDSGGDGRGNAGQADFTDPTVPTPAGEDLKKEK
jgi:hypothetical protein